MTDDERVLVLLETLLDYLPGPKAPRAYRASVPGAVAHKKVDCHACQGSGGTCPVCDGTGKVLVDPYTADTDEAQDERKRTGERRETMRPYELDRALAETQHEPTDAWTAAVERRDRAWKGGSYKQVMALLERWKTRNPPGHYLLWHHVVHGGYGVPKSYTTGQAIMHHFDRFVLEMPRPILVPKRLLSRPALKKESLWRGRKKEHEGQRTERDYMICWYAARGWRTRDIAAKFGLSIQHVNEIRRAGRTQRASPRALSSGNVSS